MFFPQERAKQAKQKRPAMKANPKVIDLSKGGDDEEGVLDNLLECLQSGSVFNPSRWVLEGQRWSVCMMAWRPGHGVVQP